MLCNKYVILQNKVYQIEKSETACQIWEQEPNSSFADEGQNPDNTSSLVDDDTVEPINEIAETNEEFLLNSQPIVMDDIAFNILENATEMTMETSAEGIQLPKESEEETNIKPRELFPIQMRPKLLLKRSKPTRPLERVKVMRSLPV